jgi:hypothetical protein
MVKAIRIPLTQVHVGRFLFLLATMFFLFAAVPLLEGLVGIRLLIDIFFSALLISGIFAISDKRSTAIIGLVIAVTAFIARWSGYFLANPLVSALDEVLGGVFSAYAAIAILSYVFRQKEVTADVIYGAFCVYLFFGLMWAFLFSFMEIVQPGSFDIETPSTYGFIYYSFVTQTTLGYGEITPTSGAARSFSALEAIIGQLYLAVTVARLVGIHISQSLSKQSG